MSEQAKVLEALTRAADESGGQLTPVQLAAMAEAVSKKKEGSSAASLPDTITLGALVDAFPVIKELAQQMMDGASARKVVLLHKWALPYMERFEKARLPILERIAEKVSEGKFQVAPGKMGELQERLAPIRAETIALDPKLKLPAALVDSLKITPAQLLALGALMADE